MTQHQLTVGVLGHVDHGKTALVKALTGVDTDRLEEEKRRGLSIVLGFAYLGSKQGIIDFIDAPGHESFIRTMISGATGIDAGLLVVAADEGIKPQTREHLAIAQLLGIKQGLIVLTKSDIVDEDLMDMAREEIQEYVQGTFLQNAPVHSVSALHGTGLEELIQALYELRASKPERTQYNNFYLPLDRVFTMDGFGTIGTGTLRNGPLKCDDEVEIMPSRLKASIREIQVHGEKVTEVQPGQRVAVNLRGVKRDQLQRGQILTKPGSVHETTTLYARLQMLENLSRVPKRNEAVRLLFGTEEVIGKLRVVEESVLEPGSELLVQFRCQDPIVVSTGEHFIVRTCSPTMTFGGGEVLDTSELLLHMPREIVVKHLQKLRSADNEGKISAHIEVMGMSGIRLSNLLERTMVSPSEIKAVIKATNALVVDDNIVVDRSAYDRLCEIALNELKVFHKNNPSQVGQDLEHFRAQRQVSSSIEVVEFLIRHLSDKKKIVVDGNTIRLADFSQEDNFSNSDRELIGSIELAIKEKGITTTVVDEITGKDPAKKRAYQYLKEAGRLIPLRESSGRKMLVFHTEILEDIKKQLSDTYPPPEKFTVADFRTLTDSTRKYVIPILEYFDQCRFTVRQGDYRTLSGTSSIRNN